MRGLRFTLLALVVIGAAAWLAIRMLGEPRKPVAARAPLVPEELVNNWDEIDLDLLSDQDLRIVREPGVVKIRFGSSPASPKKLMYSDAVDQERLVDLLRALRDSVREPLSGSPEDLLRAGLDPPRFHLTIRRTGGGDSPAQREEVALGFGNDDPTGTGILARCYTDGTVFRTSRQVANLLSFNLRDWRSKTVFGVDPLGINQIDVIHYPPDGDPELLTVVREGPRTWRIAHPSSLKGDAQACSGLAQQLSLLKIETFVAMEFSKDVVKVTGFPDHPEWSIQVSSDSRQAPIELVVGGFLEGQGYSCLLPQRGESMVFTIAKDRLDPILHAEVDSLRPRRLFPRIDQSLVHLECQDAAGATRWQVEREAKSPRGKWMIQKPFEARANGGQGSGSFAQVVVELDRTEVDAFLPQGTPFTKEATLVLQWPNEAAPGAQVLMKTELEIERDAERQRTLVRDPSRPDELFAVSPRLGALIDLDLELCRDRTIFPDAKEFLPKIKSWKLVAPGRDPIECARGDNQVVEAVGSTPGEMVPKLQSAAGELLGQPCSGYVRARSVLGKPGAVDPFATTLLELTLETYEGGPETLVVSGAPDRDQSPDGVYCKLVPRLPDDVWMIVPRSLFGRLIELR